MSISLSTPAFLRPTEAARLELSRYIADAEHSLVDCLRHICAVAAATLQVERVGIWLFVEGKSAIRCANLFERSKDEHSEGALLRLADFPRYFEALQKRRAVPAEFAVIDPRTSELGDAYLKPLNICSMLDAAIYHDGAIAGVVCHEHVDEAREWTTEERDFAGSIADLVTLKLKSAQLSEMQAAFRTQGERMAALEKADALAQMAAGVAHDFNNLLAIVSSHAELLTARSDMPAPARAGIEEISEAARRGTALVKELLEFARPNGNSPTALNLADTTAGFLAVLRAAVGVGYEIQFERPAAIGQVLVDKTQFTRVLLNLVVNARDAMPNGGPIQVRILPVRTTEDGGPVSNYVLLEVVDRGVGMSDDTQQRLFEPFFTTKPKGTGLGMPIVRRVVDRAGGFIRIESKLGAGTSIRVFFPRVGGGTGNTGEYPVPPQLRQA